LAAVVEAMRSGNAYVNVHTDDGVDPADTGPGDFPDSEEPSLGDGDLRYLYSLGITSYLNIIE
jgi:hypothetical protein